MSKKPYTTPRLTKLDYKDRTQHGDPVQEQGGSVLSAEELAGKASVKPTVTGPIAATQLCGLCREPVRSGEACPVCAPTAKPTQFMGRNGIDSTLQRAPGTVTNDTALPWMRAIR